MRSFFTVTALFFAALTLPMGMTLSAQLKLKKSFRDCPQCPEMVVIPSGTFMIVLRQTKKVVMSMRSHDDESVSNNSQLASSM